MSISSFQIYDGKILTENDLKRTGSFPLDYNFCNDTSKSAAKYLIGMSVPPVMTAKISTQIYSQWLSKL